MFLLACGGCRPDYSEPIIWLIAVIIAFVISLRRHDRAVPDPLAVGASPACPRCRYALEGLSPQGLCPECGNSYDITAPTKLQPAYTCHGFGCQLAAIAVAYCCFWPYALAAEMGYQRLRGWSAQDAAYQVWQRDVPNISRVPPFWYDPSMWFVFAAVIAILAPFLSFRARWAMLISGTLAGAAGSALALFIVWKTGRVLTPGWEFVQFYTTLPMTATGGLIGARLARTRAPAADRLDSPGESR